MSHGTGTSITSRASPRQYLCSICSKTFTFRNNLSRHVRKMHAGDSRADAKVLVFKCPLCDSVDCKSALLSHFTRDHSLVIETERLQFSSFEKFESWKLAIERQTAASFVKLRQDYMSKTLSRRRSNYYCHRDGRFRPCGRSVRRLKTQGSNKINAHCPASMTVVVTDPSSSFSGYRVDVTFVKTHVGHDMEPTRLTLMKNERDEIARKIADQVPFDSILESSIVGIRKEGKLTRQDLYNIEMAYNLNKAGVRNRADLSHMDEWVTQMNQENESNVLFYKGSGSPHPLFADSDFMIILTNSVQNEMLVTHGSQRVCLDSTVGFKSLDVELFVIYNVDCNQQAFPCAFIFTNRVDHDALTHLFSEVEDSVQFFTKTEVLLADMNAPVRDAWISAVGKPSAVLCNSWQVAEHWKNNLNLIKDAKKRDEVFSRLETLLEEKDESHFHVKLKHVTDFLNVDPKLEAFRKFFHKFANNPKEWAEWRRKELGVSTAHLRRLRKSLVDIYRQTRRNKLLDRTIESLIRFVKVKLFDDKFKMDKTRLSSRLKEIKKRHDRAMENTVTEVTQDGDSWTVQRAEGRPYRVERSHSNCDCELRCVDCATCVHTFICTCDDSTARWNMCTHIHIVSQLAKAFVQTDFTVDGNEFNNDISTTAKPQEMVVFDQSSVEQAINVDDFRQTITTQLNNIMMAVENITSFEGLEAIMNMLDPVVESANSYRKKEN